MQSALLTCPHCKEQGEQQLTPFLDLGKHPKQKLAILTDSLFTLTCPSCKQQYSVLHELLVVDEKQHYAFMLIPDTELGEVDGKVTGKEEFDEYLLRLVGRKRSRHSCSPSWMPNPTCLVPSNARENCIPNSPRR